MASNKKVFQLRGEKSYSQAVEADGLIFIAGTVSWDDDFNVVGVGSYEEQVRRIYADIGRTLTALGLDAGALVKETIFTRDMDGFVAVSAARAEFYGAAPPPASTWLQISKLARDDLLVEINAVAAR